MEEQREKSEAKIQQTIVMHYHNSYCLAHHSPRQLLVQIPNQNHHGLSLVGGISIGASDLFVIPGGHVRKSQKVFRAHCEQSGIPYYIVDNLEDFKALVKQWDHPIQDH